jgi:hypothetical protein
MLLLVVPMDFSLMAGLTTRLNHGGMIHHTKTPTFGTLETIGLVLGMAMMLPWKSILLR